MKSRWSSLLVFVFFAACAGAQTTPPAQATPPASTAPTTVRWSEGDKSSESVVKSGVLIEVLHGPALDVAVSFSDLHQYSTRAWVPVLNHGDREVALDPAKATLQLLRPRPQTLPALDPDKLAGSIKQVSDVQAQNRATTGGCPYMGRGCERIASGVAASHETKQTADAIIQDVTTTALRAQTVDPGTQAQGAVYFQFEPNRREWVLRLPIGSQVFEFPFTAEKK